MLGNLHFCRPKSFLNRPTCICLPIAFRWMLSSGLDGIATFQNWKVSNPFPAMTTCLCSMCPTFLQKLPFSLSQNSFLQWQLIFSGSAKEGAITCRKHRAAIFTDNKTNYWNHAGNWPKSLSQCFYKYVFEEASSKRLSDKRHSQKNYWKIMCLLTTFGSRHKHLLIVIKHIQLSRWPALFFDQGILGEFVPSKWLRSLCSFSLLPCLDVRYHGLHLTLHLRQYGRSP